jgi:hypothetical protein
MLVIIIKFGLSELLSSLYPNEDKHILDEMLRFLSTFIQKP